MLLRPTEEAEEVDIIDDQVFVDIPELLTETGFVQGPFYEIETSSPGAALAPGESLTHVQYTIHIQGNPEQLSAIAEAVFGVKLDKIAGIFAK